MIDVVFVIGSNGNKAKEIFNKEKTIIEEMLDSGTTADTKYSIIQYGDKEVIKGGFSDLSTPKDLKRLLDQLKWEGQGTRVDNSLALASELFTSGSRLGARKVLMVFAGELVQPFTSDLNDMVTRLAKNGVRIIPVILGDPADPSTFVAFVPNVKDPVTGSVQQDPKEIADEIGKATFTGNF